MPFSLQEGTVLGDKKGHGASQSAQTFPLVRCLSAHWSGFSTKPWYSGTRPSITAR